MSQVPWEKSDYCGQGAHFGGFWHPLDGGCTWWREATDYSTGSGLDSAAPLPAEEEKKYSITPVEVGLITDEAVKARRRGWYSTLDEALKAMVDPSLPEKLRQEFIDAWNAASNPMFARYATKYVSHISIPIHLTSSGKLAINEKRNAR